MNTCVSGNEQNVVNITINQSPSICNNEYLTTGDAYKLYYPLNNNVNKYLSSGTIIDFGEL